MVSSQPQDEILLRAETSLLAAETMFVSNYSIATPVDEHANELRIAAKIASDYGGRVDMTAKLSQESRQSAHKTLMLTGQTDMKDKIKSAKPHSSNTDSTMLVDSMPEAASIDHLTSATVLSEQQRKQEQASKKSQGLIQYRSNDSGPLLAVRNRPREIVRPDWHAPWKLSRVISGHLGWVRCAAFDISNEWFVTGSADRTIKIWDLASGQLKLTLTGHVHTIRGVVVSNRHPYMFSGGEDKMVKCWDLETNRVIRSYHGHLSGVHCIDLHPTIDVLVTGARDSTARVWDIRTKSMVHVLTGHKHTVSSVQCQSPEPQIITGSHDFTVRLWDLAAGKTRSVLTHHKKSIRTIAVHPNEYTFASGSSDNIKVWKCPDGKFLRNITGHNTIVNSLSVNTDNVLVSGGDDGSLYFFDWKSGYNYQQVQSVVQPGSLEAEAGILGTCFDRTGTRLVTCESDKTIKIWKQDNDATPESHPIDMDLVRRAQRSQRY